MTVLCLALLGALFHAHAHSAQVTFQWDYPPVTASGFILYCGAASGVYPASGVDVGNRTTTTLAGLTEGIKYYCAVTAYDAAKIESGKSAELVVTPPYSAPVADFTMTPASGAAPLSVAFSNKTTGSVTSWSWDFGDNTTSPAQNPPAHSYSTPGSYTVKLTATGPGGTVVKTATTPVIVSAAAAPPVPNFTMAPKTGAAPLSVTFSNTSTGSVTAWSWDFGDNTISTAQNPPVHLYSVPGSYTVKLTATGPGGAVTKLAATPISVSAAPPVADFTTTSNRGAAPLKVTFSNTTTGNVTSWSWTFGDGATSTDRNPVPHIYSAAGSYTVQLTATGPGGSTTKTGSVAVGMTGLIQDLDGDGKADLLWRQTSTGDVSTWLMSGGAVKSYLWPVGASGVAADWVIQVVGDFDGDRKADILWRQASTGDVSIWLMSGGAVKAYLWPVGMSGVPADWVIQGVGDFDGDGKADILWRQTSTGDVSMWLMSGGAVKAYLWPVGVSGMPADWVIQGVGDFDGDGTADILWRQASTGTVAMWLMSGGGVKSNLGAVGVNGVAADWVIQGVGDFDGDGKADILWRQPSTGTVAMWLMSGGTVKSNLGVVGVSGVAADWVIEGVGDFDGDGKADILWRQASTGTVAMWLMSGGTVKSNLGTVGVSGVAADWVIQP